MAKKNRRNKSDYNRFRRTLSKACLSIASIPVLLANPASAIAAASITINNTTRTSRVSLEGGLGLSISSTGWLTPFPDNIAVDLTGDRAAGNINNDGMIYTLNPDTAIAINLTGGTALGLTNDATPGAYATIEAYSGYSSPSGYSSRAHQSVGIGTNIDTTNLVGITNNSGGTILGRGKSNVQSKDNGYFSYAYSDSRSSAIGTGISIASSPLTGGITNLGTIAGNGDMISSASSEAMNDDAYAYSGGQGVGRGLDVYYSTIAAGISNTGTITGTANAHGTATANAYHYTWYTGYSYGFYNAGAYADVNASGIGVAIAGGSNIGSITNNFGGVIEGYGYSHASAQAYGYSTGGGGADAFAKGVGISIDSSTISGNITNSGTITGEGHAGAYEGRWSGTADGQGVGIGLTDSTVTGDIVNSGLIEGRGNQIYGYGYNSFGVGINVDNSSVGNITNNSGADIVGRSQSYSGGYFPAPRLRRIGGYGVNGAGIKVSSGGAISSINNSGTIAGYADYSAAGISAESGGTIGTITNNANGYIFGYGGFPRGPYAPLSAGVRAYGGEINGIITNSGDISGFVGISAQGDGKFAGTISGDIVNETSGYIGGYDAGIGSFYGGTISGDISNKGTVYGGSFGIGAEKYSSITGSITNYGEIYGYTGILSAEFSSVGNITNNGDIIGQAGYRAKGFAGTGISAGSYSSIGAITNNAYIYGMATGISASGYYSSIGAITNNTTGTIVGRYSAGITSVDGGSITSITNNGDIFGNDSAILNDWGSEIGDITNNGDIIGRRAGIYGFAGTTFGTITNNASGTIYSELDTIRISGGTTGSIVNSGQINSGYYGFGIRIENSKFTGTVDGDITNLAGGVISGKYGIYVTGKVTGSIQNAGTISGYGTVYGDGAAIILGTGFANTVTNTGLINGHVELGIGTLDLDGDAGRVTGAIAGAPGSTVNVNGLFTSENTIGTIDNFNIANGGTFNMAHTVTAASGVSNDGILAVAAGSSVTIEGDYTQTANGVFRTGATSSSEYGQLTVTGTADLSTSNKVDVNVTPADTLVDGDVLTSVLSAGTLNAGALTVTDDSALWDFIGSLNGNAIDLSVEKAMNFVDALQGTPQEPAAQGAAQVLDGISDGGNASGDMQTVLDAFGAIENPSDVAKAVAKTLPGFMGTYARMTERVMAANGNRIMKNRLNRLRGLSSGDETSRDIELWGDIFTSQTEQDPVDNIDGYEADSYGLSIGVDSQISPEWRLGAAFTYGQSEIDGNGTLRTESLDIDTYQGTLYAIGEIGENTELTLSAAYGHNENEAVRDISFTGISRKAKADFNSWHTYLDAELAHSHQLSDKTTLTPSLSAKYTYANVEDYTETGAGALNLHVEGTSADSLVTMLDARVDHAATGQVSLNAHAGVGYDLLTDRSSVSSSFQGGGSTFITEGFEPEPVVINGGVGIEIQSESGTTLSISYDVEARKDYDNQTAWLKLSIPLK